MPAGVQVTGQRLVLEAAPSRAQQATIFLQRSRPTPFSSRHCHQAAASSCACAAVASASYEDKEVSNLDVNQAVISPSFRSTPWRAEEKEDSSRTVARICFVSESNVCRSPLALGAFNQLLEEHGMEDLVECLSRGTRDYNVGEGIEPSAVEAALELGIPLPEGFAAQTFDYEQDIVHYDMVLVVDKFVAADVMREISVYDTINKGGNYTKKVRRLGEFHPELGNALEYDGQDIDDPLYGNEGGDTERRAVLRTAALVRESCEGLMAFLKDLQSTGTGNSLCKQLNDSMKGMKELEWLVPPMLQKR